MFKKQKGKEITPPESLPIIEENELMEDKETNFDNVLASWEFPEHEKMERGKWWYLIFGLALVGCLLYAYFSQNPMFAIILVLFIIIYIIIERRGITMVKATLTISGLFINNKFLEYKSFTNFYIIYYPPHTKSLYLQPKNNFKAIVHLPLQEENPITIREILLKFLPEDLTKEEIPATDGISRLLKL
jgi:hypothetical protein